MKNSKELDSLFVDAAKMVVEIQGISSTMLMRKFLLGYNRAWRIINQLEEHKIISKYDGLNKRIVLIKTEKELNTILTQILPNGTTN